MANLTDTTNLTKALEHLRVQYQNFARSSQRPELTHLDRDALAESVVQRFETAYDCAWKTLKHFLGHEVGLPDLPNSPKPILRIAAESNVLHSPIENWLSYADARTATAHDYSGKKAEQARELVQQFLEDCQALLISLSATP